ncbi:MAG TPA: hypothetical protein VLJ16_04220 [Acidobacteriota bacterium]|nr:hypothetical protein [Acidobacteriota bacterium]
MRRAGRINGSRRIAAGLAAAGIAASLFFSPPSAWSRPRKPGVTVTLYYGAAVAKGELIGIRADAIVVLTEETEAAVPLVEIDKIRVSRGLNKTGGAIGALVGAAAGFVIGGSYEPKPPTGGTLGEQLGQSVGEAVKAAFRPFIGITLGGGAGALFGATIGTAATRDKIILVKGRPETEVGAELDALRKRARVPDYR